MSNAILLLLLFIETCFSSHFCIEEKDTGKRKNLCSSKGVEGNNMELSWSEASTKFYEETSIKEDAPCNAPCNFIDCFVDSYDDDQEYNSKDDYSNKYVLFSTNEGSCQSSYDCSEPITESSTFIKPRLKEKRFSLVGGKMEPLQIFTRKTKSLKEKNFGLVGINIQVNNKKGSVTSPEIQITRDYESMTIVSHPLHNSSTSSDSPSTSSDSPSTSSDSHSTSSDSHSLLPKNPRKYAMKDSRTRSMRELLGASASSTRALTRNIGTNLKLKTEAVKKIFQKKGRIENFELDETPKNMHEPIIVVSHGLQGCQASKIAESKVMEGEQDVPREIHIRYINLLNMESGMKVLASNFRRVMQKVVNPQKKISQYFFKKAQGVKISVKDASHFFNNHTTTIRDWSRRGLAGKQDTHEQDQAQQKQTIKRDNFFHKLCNEKEKKTRAIALDQGINVHAFAEDKDAKVRVFVTTAEKSAKIKAFAADKGTKVKTYAIHKGTTTKAFAAEKTTRLLSFAADKCTKVLDFAAKKGPKLRAFASNTKEPLLNSQGNPTVKEMEYNKEEKIGKKIAIAVDCTLDLEVEIIASIPITEVTEEQDTDEQVNRETDQKFDQKVLQVIITNCKNLKILVSSTKKTLIESQVSQRVLQLCNDQGNKIKLLGSDVKKTLLKIQRSQNLNLKRTFGNLNTKRIVVEEEDDISFKHEINIVASMAISRNKSSSKMIMQSLKGTDDALESIHEEFSEQCHAIIDVDGSVTLVLNENGKAIEIQSRTSSINSPEVQKQENLAFLKHNTDPGPRSQRNKKVQEEELLEYHSQKLKTSRTTSYTKRNEENNEVDFRDDNSERVYEAAKRAMA